MNDTQAQTWRQQTRERIARLQHRLAARGLAHRAPPPEPQTCCGRGCNGCVWEGYDAALAWWFEDASLLLQAPQSDSASTVPSELKGTNEPT
jgi:hypothetical protein